jgi:hypothetical protein
VTLQELFVPVAIAVIAAAYAGVGQAGATGYIAAMGLAGNSPDIIRPAALALNTLGPTETEADRAHADPLGHAHGSQHW